jgi:hypothetical protein
MIFSSLALLRACGIIPRIISSVVRENDGGSAGTTTPNPGHGVTPTDHAQFDNHFGAASPPVLSLKSPPPSQPNIPPREAARGILETFVSCLKRKRKSSSGWVDIST